LATLLLRPDVSVLVDADPEVARSRVAARSAGDEHPAYAYERVTLRERYLALARTSECLVVDTSAASTAESFASNRAEVDALIAAPPAAFYQRAFGQAWNTPGKFRDSEIAAKWSERTRPGLPSFMVSFAPHRKAGVALEHVADAIKQANSSVLFSIMHVGRRRGPDEIRRLPKRTGPYAFGTTQRASGSFTVHAPGRPTTFIPFAFLKKKVPEPFRPEIGGGSGQLTISSTSSTSTTRRRWSSPAHQTWLPVGRRTTDNLLAFYDRNVVTTYALEAVRLIDHYRFRAA
jgi:hypothetical protein